MNFFQHHTLSQSRKIKPIQPQRQPQDIENVKPIIQNIVCTADLGCKLNLTSLVLKANNAEYNPKRFSAAIMRIRSPKTTALIFSSGKLVCTGAKSEMEAKQATRMFARIIQKLDNPVCLRGFKIQNMVASYDMRIQLNLESMTWEKESDHIIIYDPPVFPGLIYKMVKPRLTNLVFGSGKVVLAGAKCQSDIDDAFEYLVPYVMKYKKKI